jgi:hypothetical protein
MAPNALKLSDLEQRAGFWLTQNGKLGFARVDLWRSVVCQFLVILPGYLYDQILTSAIQLPL